MIVQKDIMVSRKRKLTISQQVLLFSLYTTQFLGLGFFTEALIAILRQAGVSLENLGMIYMIGLFWVLRFIWAPFVDKFELKGYGKYRGWILVFQSLMVICLFFTMFYTPQENLKMVIIFTILFAFFSASQDIALDALAYKIAFKRQRSTVNALKTTGGLVGMVVGGGLGLVSYTYIGWDYTMFIGALITAFALVLTFFYKEPNIKNSFIESKIDFKQYIHFWRGKKRKQWLLLLFIYPVTISSAFGMITPILVDLGWSLDKIGYTVHIVGYGIGAVASFISAWLIQRFGRKTILVVAAIGQTIGIVMLLILIHGHDSAFSVMFVVGFVFSFYTPSQVVMCTLMMDQASKKTPASQFAIQHSIYMFSGIFFSSISISLAGVYGYSNVIIACSLIGVFAIFIARNIDSIILKEQVIRSI